MTDDPLTVCPQCNGTIRRILFAAGIVFKGSGFYKTDHGNGQVVGDNHANNHHDSSENKEESTAKTESTGESKTSSEKNSGEKTTGEKTSSAPVGESKSKATAAAD